MVDETATASTGTPPAIDWGQLVDDLDEAVVAVDHANTVVYANQAVERLLHHRPGELVGRPLTCVIPDRFKARHLQAFTDFVRTGRSSVIGRPLVLSALRGDGTELPVELLISETRSAGGLLVGLLRDVSERVEVEGPAGLSDLLIATFAEAPSLDDALPRVCEALGDALGWELATLWLVEDEDRLSCRASWARDPEAFEPFTRASHRTFARGEGLPGAVWTSGAPTWVSDLKANAQFRRQDAAAAAGLHSGFVFPLVAGRRTVGVVETFSVDRRDPSPSVIARLAFVGRELGWFIDRRLAEEARIALLESERQARADAEASRERLRFLAESSEALARTLDLDETLSTLTSLAVPTMGAWCVIHLLDGEDLPVAAAAHADPSRVALLLEAHQRYPTRLDAPDGVGAAIRTGATRRWDIVDDETLQRIARDEHHLDLLRRLGFGSVVTVPLAAQGRPLGAVTVASEPGGTLHDTTVVVVEDLARRASVAIDNATLHRELQAAHDRLELQAALLTTQADAGMEGQVVVSPNGEMISFNRGFVEMWGFPEAVLEGRSDEEALRWASGQVDDADVFHARVRDLYADPRPARDELRLRDGRVFDRYGAPLLSGGETLGYAWYFRDVTDQKRTEWALAEARDRVAAVATTLQRSLLPPRLPRIAGVDLGARYHPSPGAEVGGDFYDAFRLGDDRWGVVIGDVCGKGPEAAAVTAFVRYTIRATAMQSTSPAEALRRLNDAMVREAAATGGVARFVTVAHAWFRRADDGIEVEASSGGHPLPVVRRTDGTVEPFGRFGTLIGVLPHVELHDDATLLRPGEAMVFVTDGVLEARRHDLRADERLRQVIAGAPGADADAVAAAVESYAVAEQQPPGDDIAVFVIAVALR